MSDEGPLVSDPKVRQRTAFSHASLTMLLDRVGGRIEFTEAEYQAVVRNYGGPSMMNIRFEVARQEGHPDRVVARLERKLPNNLELPS